uniref:Glycosyl transferase CAP10 domain-containing protein n=1 Tax=Oryza brachyantha TaxID=4533 RepID=J3MBC7_ORYBR
MNLSATYDSRTNDVESSVVARGDLWRAEASHSSAATGGGDGGAPPLFLVQLGPVLFVRDTTLLFPVHLSKRHLIWYGFERKNGVHSVCPAYWSAHRRWFFMSMICLNPFTCSFMDMQFPNGQLRYVAGDGFTTRAFLPLCRGIFQAHAKFPGEKKLSYSFKPEASSLPFRIAALSTYNVISVASRTGVEEASLQCICPTFGGSRPGLSMELIHSLNENAGVVCGYSHTASPSAYASISIGRSKLNGSAASSGQADGGGDAGERAALAPVENGVPPPSNKAGRRWPPSPAVLRMRGVGSVMVGVVFLALLILIPRWLGLDASFLRDSTMLMRRYAGRVPDVDIMFACDDPGQVRAADFAAAPADAPPVFRYCKDKTTLDVVFPDWSFWGWPEVNIGAWPGMLEAVRRENERVRWPEREPFAFWKGNPGVARIRGELMKCNPSNGKDWNARLFTQDWNHAIQNGFKDSSIPKQCLHRYKIYIEGNAWSVSEKYILACDSPVLFVTTPYQDILSRGLVAGEHYWPINRTRMCGSIKLAVDWGNAHPAAARRIGERGSRFVREQMSMDYVYDYMLHLLTEYGKLLRYRPAVPEKAVEICAASMACPAKGRRRECMDESVEEFVAGFEPCALPPPFTEEEAREIAAREEKVLRRVEKMEENIAS